LDEIFETGNKAVELEALDSEHLWADGSLARLKQQNHASKQIEYEEGLRPRDGNQIMSAVDRKTLHIPLDYNRIGCKLQEDVDRLQQEMKDHAAALTLAKEIREQREAEEKRKLAEHNKPRECVVCGDSKKPLDFPSRPATRECEHKPQTCTDCMQSWLSSEFDSKGTDGINCPECPQSLSHGDFRFHAWPTTFTAYDKRTALEALSALPDFAWCLAPGCGSGQLNINNQNFMDCVSCKAVYCVKHKVVWHKGETCEEYDLKVAGRRKKADEAATEAMLDAVSKKCPGLRGKCGWRIQKTSGCDQ